jgi:hypothetical protein
MSDKTVAAEYAEKLFNKMLLLEEPAAKDQLEDSLVGWYWRGRKEQAKHQNPGDPRKEVIELRERLNELQKEVQRCAETLKNLQQ